MGRYNFVSEGGAGAKAIEEFFVKQALEERQRMLDEQARAEQAATIRQRDQQLAQQAARDAESARSGEATRTALQEERDFRRGTTVATNLPPGIVDAGTGDLLKRTGYGFLVREGLPQQGAQTGEEDGVPLYDVSPGVLETPGGFQWQQARQQAEERAAQATAAQQAAAERAAADREARAEQARQADETRRMLGQMSAGARGDSAALRDEMTRLRIEAERTKQETAKQTQQASTDAVEQYRNEVRSLVSQMLDQNDVLTPEVARVVGPFSSVIPNMTGTANKGQSLVERLKGLLTLEKIAEMKRQSRTGATGLGATNAKEFATLESAASTLSAQGVNEDDYARELLRVLQTVGGRPTAQATPTTETPEQRRARIIREAAGR